MLFLFDYEMIIEVHGVQELHGLSVEKLDHLVLEDADQHLEFIIDLEGP
jgi:hypothetical protein